MAFSLTWLPKVLLDAALKVAEQSGGEAAGAAMLALSRASSVITQPDR